MRNLSFLISTKTDTHIMQFFDISTCEQLLTLYSRFFLFHLQFGGNMLLILIKLIHHKIISIRTFWCRAATNFAHMVVNHFLHCLLVGQIPWQFCYVIRQHATNLLQGFLLAYFLGLFFNEGFLLFSFLSTKIRAFLLKLCQNRRESA